MPEESKNKDLNPSLPPRIRYIHPKDLLSMRLTNAYQDASQLVDVSLDNYKLGTYDLDGQTRIAALLREDAYCDDPYKMFFAPARKSLKLAIPAAVGIGTWLRWGLQDRGGVLETELRSALSFLSSWAFHFPNLVFYDVLKIQLSRWKESIEVVSTTIADLEHVAIESRDPTEWYQLLRDIMKASAIMSETLERLYHAAESKTEPLSHHKEAARASVVFFRELLERACPRLVYLLEGDDEGLQDHLEHFVDRLLRRVYEMSDWGMRRRDPKWDQPEAPFAPYGEPVSKTLAWLESWIDYFLFDDSQPEVAATSSPTVAGRESRQRTEPPDLSESKRIARSAEEAVKMLKMDRAPVASLAKITGQTCDVVRSKINRAINKNPTLRSLHVFKLESASPGAAKKAYGIKAFWPFIQPATD